MSYSYQSRNVRFLRLRFNGSCSLITMFTKLKAPPGMIHWGSVGFDPFWDNQRLLCCQGSCGDFLKSQGSVFVIDTHGTIDSVLDHHLGGMDLILNLIELPVISYGKVIS